MSNYKYPRITADEIIEILKQHEFELTPEAEAFLLAALGPDYAADSVLVVAAELIAGIFRRPLLQQKIDALLSAILASLLLTRDDRRGLLDRLGDRFCNAVFV